YGAGLNAAYMLSLKPAALGEEVQERCWQVVAGAMAFSVQPIRDRGENWMAGGGEKVAWVVQTLAAVPGPIREPHRSDFVAMRDCVHFHRLAAPPPDKRYPALPDLTKVDWRAGSQ